MRSVKNRTIFTGDNLHVLRGMQPDSIDLIYLDPPFNSKHDYAAPIGSKAAGAEFKDTWTLDDIDKAWIGQLADEHPKLEAIIDAVGLVNGDSSRSYLLYMAVRLIEMHRVLKDTGSLYLHCDPVMSHSLKLLLDGIFSKNNYRNEIIWHYNTGGASRRQFSKKHDVLHFYNRCDSYQFEAQREPFRTSKTDHFNQIDEDGRAYRIREANGKEYKYYADEGRYCHDVWEIDAVNAAAKERTGYPTQKPLKLLERIIKASSKPGDMVLDPFCGCGTTCVAAEMLGRQWIGIDISPKATELVRRRLE